MPRIVLREKQRGATLVSVAGSRLRRLYLTRLVISSFVHLHVRSWFSFLDGASSPHSLARLAASHGQEALALTDRSTLAGAARFARACQQQGIKPIFGATLEVEGAPLILLASDREGYANLCDLLTLAHLDRGHPHLTLQSLGDRREGGLNGLLCLSGDRNGLLQSLVRAKRCTTAIQWAKTLAKLFPNRFWVELTHHRRPGDGRGTRDLVSLAESLTLPVVATGAVCHARPQDYAIHDALTCARLGLSIAQFHLERPVNACAWLRSTEAMRRLGFPPEALTNTAAIADMCHVELLPEEVTPPRAALPPQTGALEFLRTLCRQAFARRFPPRTPTRNQAAQVLRKEVEIISTLGLEEFFLVVREVVEFARGNGIRCSGRGSAANSLVAYLLGITGVDPLRHHLLFERFLHEGRRGMPDIDVDFETHRRAEVIAWMQRRWGEEHAAMTANVITFRLRLAAREMAKVLGYPQFLVDRLGDVLPSVSTQRAGEFREEMAKAVGEGPMLDTLIMLCERLHDGESACPRHLSLHSGGMVLSRPPLRALSPIQTSANGVRQIQFSKDDVEALGLIKFDVLGLRTLSVVSEAQKLIEDHHLAPNFDVNEIPEGDAKTYELIRSGETLGVFQIESPGQWNLLSRSQPECFDDLVAQVALFRPGPLQGNMVHPFIARRRGWVKTTYAHPSLEPVLHDTYGIILYQEQVLEVAHRFAGMSLNEADEFRRLMSRHRDKQEMEAMRKRFVESAQQTHEDTAHPISREIADCVFDLLSKFVGYGFCRSHAAAFARTVYQTAYLKAHQPAAFMAALLEHKPSFYPLQTQLEEARRLGIRVLGPCIERSGVSYALEGDEMGQMVIRVPLTQIKGILPLMSATIVLERSSRSFDDLEDVWRRCELPRDVWDNLARSGALEAFGERREVLWRLGELRRRDERKGGSRFQLPLPLEGGEPYCNLREQQVENWGPIQIPRVVWHKFHELPPLRALTPSEQAVWDFETQGITTGPHPVGIYRSVLERLGAITIDEMMTKTVGQQVLLAGAVISRQRPPTAKGMAFLILEDETGRLPTAIVPPVFDAHAETLRSPGLLVQGSIEDAGQGQTGRYRSLLIQRAWPLERIVKRNIGGTRGFCGEVGK